MRCRRRERARSRPARSAAADSTERRVSALELKLTTMTSTAAGLTCRPPRTRRSTASVSSAVRVQENCAARARPASRSRSRSPRRSRSRQSRRARRARRAGRQQDGGVAGDLRHRRTRRRHDRHAGLHRFQDRQAEAFVHRRIHEQRRAAIQVQQRRLR